MLNLFHIVGENAAFPVKCKTLWELKNVPFDDIPFMVVGFPTRHCMHGPERHAKEKAKYQANQVSIL